jgi:hypothetical protein
MIVATFSTGSLENHRSRVNVTGVFCRDSDVLQMSLVGMPVTTTLTASEAEAAARSVGNRVSLEFKYLIPTPDSKPERMPSLPEWHRV